MMRGSMTVLAGTVAVFAAALGLSAVDAHAQAATPVADPGALVKNAVDALPKVPFKAQLRLTPNEGPTRNLELSHKLVGGNRSSFLEVKEPSELAGIRFLFLENAETGPEQYIKIPAGRTPVKVQGQIRKQPFLESTFFVSDLVEPKLDDFTYAFVGEEEVLGRKTKLIEATPKNPDDEIYGKTILAIDPADRLILKRQFFDHNGKLLKVWTIEKIEKVDGIWTFREQRMENVQEKTKSRLDTPEVSYNVQLFDSQFEPKSLGK
jgi:Outer membrane lipoprotein-sorting protein